MLVLALDTTTRPGSIALVRDDQVLAVASGDATRTHAERLPADIVHLLAGAGLSLSAIDVFGVAAGPGSFTGLRIGIAAVQGLAFALKRPAVGVSSLDALALIAGQGATATGERVPLVVAWMDAQRSEVFAALYERTPEVAPGLKLGSPTPEGVAPARAVREEAGHRSPTRGQADPENPTPEGVAPGSPAPGSRAAAQSQGTWDGQPVPPDGQPRWRASLDHWRLIDGPVSERPEAVLQRWQRLTAGRDVRVAGDGVGRYRSLLVEQFGERLRVVDPLPPLAPTIGQMTALAVAEGLALAPHAIRPIYVRRPDAELARDRQRAAPTADSNDA